MRGKRRKLNAGHAALLAAVAVGAVVVACDTPVPTEVREAFEEVTADRRVQRTEAEMERRSVRLRLLRDFAVTGRSRDSGPVVYLDGVRVPGPRETSDGEDPLSRLDPHDIAIIEVLKGPAARELYGDEAAGGVIMVLTKAVQDARRRLQATLAEYEAEIGQLEADYQRAEADYQKALGEYRQQQITTVLPRVEPVAELEIEELVVTVPPQAEPAAGLRAQELVVTGQARAQSLREPKATELVVTAETAAWTKWLTENAVSGTPPGWSPVIYVDDVRLDGGGPGLDRLPPTLAAHRVDRIEIIKGERAGELYGDEGERGVIRIFTKK